MDPDITFSWKGKNYTVESRAFDLSRIVLPDGTVLEVTEWIETYPPQVGKAEEIPHRLKNWNTDAIAKRMTACVAKLV